MTTPEPREMTAKAVVLGILLALVFGAANAYLGMRAGQTVAATLPAAVIAMALFRIPAFRGGILEQNIARTAASVGEALVAGAIFTIPAFVMVGSGGDPLVDGSAIALLGCDTDTSLRRAARSVLHHSSAPRAVRGCGFAVARKRGSREYRQGFRR